MSATHPELGERYCPAALVVQPYGSDPHDYTSATIVRISPTIEDGFRYLDLVELTLARHGLPLDTLDDLVVVDLDRRPLARPRCSERVTIAALSALPR